MTIPALMCFLYHEWQFLFRNLINGRLHFFFRYKFVLVLLRRRRIAKDSPLRCHLDTFETYKRIDFLTRVTSCACLAHIFLWTKIMILPRFLDDLIRWTWFGIPDLGRVVETPSVSQSIHFVCIPPCALHDRLGLFKEWATASVTND